MLCQACEKNETDEAVICGSCQQHYAAIREGRYAEHALTQGESQLVVRSWTSLGAPTDRGGRRDEKRAGRVGLFRKAPPPPEEPPPPPDWKNRVFAADEAQAAPQAPAPQDEFSYGYQEEPPAAAPLDLAPAADAGAEDPAPRVYDLTPAPAAPEAWVVEEPEPDEPTVFDLAPSEPVHELFAPEAIAPADAPSMAPGEELPASVPPVETLGVEAPVEPIAAEPAPAAAVEAPPAALANFFQGLGTAAEPEAPAAPATPPALADFLGSLSTPSAPETPTAAQPGTPASLASFFEGLSAAPAQPEPVAPTAPAAPAALSSFFESLSEPTAPAASTEPVAVEPAPQAVAPAPPPVAPPEPVQSAAPAAQPEPLADFFEVLAPAQAPVESGLAEFFETLGPAPGAAAGDVFAIVPPEFTAPTSALPETMPAPEALRNIEGRKPFSIELSDAPAGQSEPSKPAALKPPTHGAPFTIELTPPVQPSAPKAPRPSESVKKQHSTGGLSFVSDEEEEEAQGLLDGLAFYDAHDDDDDRTIEL